MRQFRKILKYELSNYFTNKVFVGITIFLMVLLIVVMFFPRFSEMIALEAIEPEDKPIMLVVSDSPENAEGLEAAFSAVFTDYQVILTEGDVSEQIRSGEAECAFVMDSLTNYKYYVNNLSMYDQNTAIADEVLLSVYRTSAMVGSGLTVEDANAIMTAQIDHETEMLGKDQMKNYFYTYIMIFALYMVILLYGQMVATNVATEKSSRAMELLITSAKPISMMFGKVIASCLAGLTQLVAVFGTAFLCFNLNKTYWDAGGIVASLFDMPLELLVYMLIFFVLGFLIYAFLFGAVGSTASKLEDINTSVMPITFLFIIGFIVVVTGMSSNEVDTVLMKVCSFVPFTSPMAMFTRICMSTVPMYEIVISILILIGTAVGVGVLSAKIYRVGVLMYGTQPKIGQILKSIKNA